MLVKYYKKFFITLLLLSFIFIVGDFSLFNLNASNAITVSHQNNIFKDKALEQAIKKVLKGNLSASSLKSLKLLNINGTNVHNLTGIEHLSNLETITLDGYKINSIVPLKNLKKLKKINMFEMSFRTYKDAYIAFGKSRVNVKISNKELDTAIREQIYQNEYSYDMKRLTLLDTEKLYSLDLQNSKVKSLNGIEALVNLNTIYLTNTQINDFSPLYKLKNLKNVCYENSQTLKQAEEYLKKSKPVVKFKDKDFEEIIRNALNKPYGQITQLDMLNITRLDIYFSTVKDISEISYCTNLTSLTIGDTCITDISPLKDLKNLQYLYLKFNDIKDFSALKSLPKVKDLTISINSDEIFSIVSSMPSLSSVNGVSFDDYRKAMKNAKDIVANLIKPSMNDYEKYIVLHDYLVENTYYDIVSLKKYLAGNTEGLYIESQSMVSVFNNKLSVCAGYAEAFSYLLNLCGIDNKIVCGTSFYTSDDKLCSAGHAWNMVKLDNKWYYCDATSDDTHSINNCINEINTPSHNYIYLSMNQLSLRDYWLKDIFPTVTDDNPLFLDFYSSTLAYNNDCYYFISNNHIGLYHILTDKTEDFLQVKAKSLKINSSYLYYINQDDNDSLYRAKLNDSTDNEKIANIKVDNYYISNDYIYFISKDAPGIYRSKLDGSEFIKLTSDLTNKLFIYKDNIYYTNLSDNSCLYKINLNGNGRLKISNCSISETNAFDNTIPDFKIVDDVIYYLDKNDGNKLYKMNCDGTGKIKLSDDNCMNLEVIKDFIYYVNAGDSGHYRINMNTSEKVKIGVWNK